jgi:hypothetical protein
MAVILYCSEDLNALPANKWSSGQTIVARESVGRLLNHVKHLVAFDGDIYKLAVKLGMDSQELLSTPPSCPCLPRSREDPS